MEFLPTHGRDGDVRALASQRLSEARELQRNLVERAEAAAGTSGEDQAAAALEKVRHEIVAREAWVVWTERGI
jgi:hypothetical protein